jgi:FKBP-type peptidyl-prolyl cis-trans isomerase
MFISFFCFASILFGADPVRDFVTALPKGQKTILNEFLLTVMDSSAGYVLHGDRPMSIENYDLSFQRIMTGPHARTAALAKGKQLWEDLNVSPDNKEFVFNLFENDSTIQVVCINRKAFLQAVKENLSLFRYVLGPTVTPENLLSAVLSAKERFFRVVKHDQVLLGILLGHGKQNALLHSRLAMISDLSTFGENEEFPYISKKMCQSWAYAPKKFHKEPSFGFGSINEEELVLNKITASSSEIKRFNNCPLPNFDCEAESEETRTLLNTYEQSRTKILKAMASKNFTEETLRKLCTTTSQTVEVPSIPKQRELCLPANKEETVSKLVEVIQKKIAMEPHAVKKFQNAFFQGVAAREKEKQMPVPPQMKRENDIGTLRKELDCHKSLERANAYFERLGERGDLVALSPNEIYYKVLKPGKGEPAPATTHKVSFQYSVQVLGDDQSKDWGIVKQEELGSLIPGIAYALIGMQQGEERVVYIHPKYAYGEETFYPPNVVIVAQIRLLDFLEGSSEVAIFPAHQLVERDYQDLMAKFEVLHGEELYDEGVEFWDAIKKSGDFIDFQTFQKFYTGAAGSQTSFQNEEQLGKFVMDLEYQLLSLRKGD